MLVIIWFFFVFSNLYQLDLHNKTHVPLAIYNEICVKPGVKNESPLISYEYHKCMNISYFFIGSICRRKTMHWLLYFKSTFPNHFGFTLRCYLFMLFLVQLMGSFCRTKTKHQLLCCKSKFPHHFAFTFGCYLFLLFLVWLIYCGC